TTLVANVLYDAFKNTFLNRQEHIRKQLSEFYNPILTLLSVNADIFEKIGPPARKLIVGEYQKEENFRVWNELVDLVIIPNNNVICDIVKANMHLISDDDSISPYLEFITHAFVYREFRKKPFEDYEKFQFPGGFHEHISQQRDNLKKKVRW
ncbi:MAG: hypothetical protein KC708_22340, partial [Anaerolineae bacterium]|nr:hypothetical protein [Anaerolineae bacterium]